MQEKYITDLDSPENRAIVEEILQQMQKNFNTATTLAHQKLEAVAGIATVHRLMQEVHHFFARKARLEEAWPKIRIAALAKHLGCEEQLPELEAACALMRLFGQLLDTRGKNGEIESDVVYPLIRPLYEPEVFNTVRQTLAYTGNPFREYCWYNNMDNECRYRVRRKEESGIPTNRAINEVAAFVTQRVNELVHGEMLRRLDAKGATMH